MTRREDYSTVDDFAYTFGDLAYNMFRFAKILPPETASGLVRFLGSVPTFLLPAVHAAYMQGVEDAAAADTSTEV